MKCAYCFSEANDASHRKTIDWKKAQHGIDLAFRNAHLLKSMGNGYEPHVRIGFTGGGEPTVEFGLLIDCLKYASSQSQELSIPYSCMLQTNGQLEPEGVIELYRNGCQSFALSIDGLQPIQDNQRRRLDGHSSFERCLSFLDTIQMLNASISLRSTLIKESVKAFPAFVRFVDSRYPFVKRINIDSLSLSGRALSVSSSRPSVDSIVRLVKMIREDNLSNLDISYHGVDLRRLAYFCSPADLGSTIYIGPSSYISLCQENPYPNEKLGTSHIVGTYDTNGFPLLNDFRTMNRWSKVKSSKQCRNCAALFFCAGGCKAKIRFSPNDAIEDSDSLYWCELAKELTPVEIHDSVFRRSLYPGAVRKTCRIGGVSTTIVLIR